MNTTDLIRIRLHNHLHAGRQPEDPQEVVSRMGAMQAQSLDLAKWAIGVRLKNRTVVDIDEALNTGRIIRTHILRPTWHFVSAEDIHWMSDLSLPRLKPVYRSYTKTLGADDALICRTVPVLGRALEGGKHLTKAEIGDALRVQNVTIDDDHLRLTISYAEMEGLLCNGRLKGSKQTFTLLNEWAPRKQTLSRDEALERLSRKYFTSHAPATVQDFAWWSGLTLTECRRGIEMIKADFVCETVNGRDFWMERDAVGTTLTKADSALLLPPFDEFVVSYKDRSEIIEAVHYGKVMTKNGLFSPTLVLNGKIVGSWKKTLRKGLPQIETSFFEKRPQKEQALFIPEKKRLERFYSPEYS